ncbi:MAG: serine hydrolase domain-containing protein [Polyangiaceae bacterium]
MSRNHLLRAMFGAFLFAACGSPQVIAPPPPPTPPPSPSVVALPPAPGAPSVEKLDRDTPRETGKGTSFIAPGGWSVQVRGESTLLVGPESDFHMAVVEPKATSLDEAVSKAWIAAFPDFKRPLKLANSRPGRRGWDERRVYDYETSPNEKRVVMAEARRHGDTYAVLLVESGQAEFERRAAHFSLVAQSLRPKGYVKESFAGKTPHKLDADRIKRITQMIDEARDVAGVPGVALSLVQGGKVVYQGGLGVKEQGKPAKTDADTLFMIASNTKALTTLLLAKLVDEGKFQWDTPVKNVDPSFKLGDEGTTSQIQMKHLICACTGMPRQDLEWLFEFKNATAKSTMDMLGTFQPTTKFGEVFQYSNPLAAAAGFVGGKVVAGKKELGAAYDEAMRTRIFAPLGMNDTTFDFERVLKGNHATPHADDIDGKTQVTTNDVNRAIVPMRPAGGAWSSVKNLTRYVQMELAKGKLPDGKPFVSEKNLLARRDKQVAVNETAHYGMGLTVDTDWGVPFVHHGGAMSGFRSDMFWFPDIDVGGVILTNSENGRMLLRPFARKTLEILFDGNDEAKEDLEASVKARRAEVAKERERLVVPPDAEIVAKLAKHYTNKALGDIAVLEDGKNRIFDFGEWKSAVATRKNDDGTTTMFTITPGMDGFEFVVTERDGKRALIVRDGQHEYVFLEAS